MAILIQLTAAGIAAVTAAAGTNQTVIAELGLTEQPFFAAPTLTALPGEFKRLQILSGTAPAPNIIHVTAYDQSAEVWNATGFGFFLEDGTLFATYSAAEPVLSKAALAFALMGFDIAINADLTAQITFGNATFVWPPATETTRGIAEIATQAELDTAADDSRFVTPKKLGTRLTALLTPIIDTINTTTATVAAISASLGNYALKAVSITGAGLASGGGDLTANRTITVTEATAAEITAGTSSTAVVTPRRLGPITMALAQNGFIRFFGFQMAWGRTSAAGNGYTAVVFAAEFPTACFAVAGGGSSDGLDAKDNWPAVRTSSITKTGFSFQAASDDPVDVSYIAVGY